MIFLDSRWPDSHWAGLVQLFHGHADLILQFNTFLPVGYKVPPPPPPPVWRTVCIETTCN
jgi:hypothetical protein